MVPGLELVAAKQQPLALGSFLAPLAGVIAVSLGQRQRGVIWEALKLPRCSTQREAVSLGAFLSREGGVRLAGMRR